MDLFSSVATELGNGEYLHTDGEWWNTPCVRDVLYSPLIFNRFYTASENSHGQLSRLIIVLLHGR